MYNKDTAVFLEENSFSLIPRITTKHSKQPPKSYTVKTLSYLTKGDSSSRIFSTTFNCTKHKKIKKNTAKQDITMHQYKTKLIQIITQMANNIL